MDGFELLKIIRADKVYAKTPAIFLTSNASRDFITKGISLGIDDYIVKPFDIMELLARVDSVLRRIKKAEKQFCLGDVKVDLAGRQVYFRDQLVDFTPQEFSLIEVLIQNRNIALSRERLLDIAWGYEYVGDTRTVDVHICYIRKKLLWEGVIKTVYKMGYRLEVGQ
jgi:DNA-binding response OmpR family regulator